MSQAGVVNTHRGAVATDGFNMQTGTTPVVPDGSGLVTFNGATVAAGTHPVRTDGTGANTMALEVQISQAIAASDATKIGLANFDSAAFDVDANGFVQLNGGGIAATSFTVDANTAPGTNPVVPTAAGGVTIEAAAVAAHSVPIETRSRAANTFKVEVQEASAVAATDATKSGIAHFDSARFTVDANGFVSTNGSGIAETITGNSGGALSPTAGNWNVVTANSTVKFVGSVSTLTQDFGLTNLLLGSSGASITAGTNNTALGNAALTAVAGGASNVAVGSSSLNKVNSGNENTGVGASTLANITGGGQNVAIGKDALISMTGGSSNVAIGYSAGSSLGAGNSNNIYIGASVTGTSGENHITRLGTGQTTLYASGTLVTDKGRIIEVTTPGAYPYTVLNGDHLILADSSAAHTINLLSAPETGRLYYIKDVTGSAATNNITVSGNGKNIDGVASRTIASNYGSLTVVYNGTEYNVI